MFLQGLNLIRFLIRVAVGQSQYAQDARFAEEIKPMKRYLLVVLSDSLSTMHEISRNQKEMIIRVSCEWGKYIVLRGRKRTSKNVCLRFSILLVTLKAVDTIGNYSKKILT